jgi:hypothetical protein
MLFCNYRKLAYNIDVLKKQKHNMNTIKLTLLGIMVMLAASLRAQNQQITWLSNSPTMLVSVNNNLITGLKAKPVQFPSNYSGIN